MTHKRKCDRPERAVIWQGEHLALIKIAGYSYDAGSSRTGYAPVKVYLAHRDEIYSKTLCWHAELYRGGKDAPRLTTAVLGRLEAWARWCDLRWLLVTAEQRRRWEALGMAQKDAREARAQHGAAHIALLAAVRSVNPAERGGEELVTLARDFRRAERELDDARMVEKAAQDELDAVQNPLRMPKDWTPPAELVADKEEGKVST